MKKLILIYLATCVVASAHETSIELLKEKAETAARSDSYNSFENLYDWTNVHFILKDQEMRMWNKWRSFVPENYVLKGVEWVPITEFSQDMQENLLEPETINGRVYKWNFKPVGRLVFTWSSPTKTGHTSTNFIMVGMNSESYYVCIAPMVLEAGVIISK